MSPATGNGHLAEVLADARLIVTCGPGGVGKTTTAAALGLAAARSGRRVCVVTIDPARRLADALGVGTGTTDEPHLVDPTIAGIEGSGSFSALMLDAERTFDRLITDRAGDGAERILENRIYRGIAGSLGGAQEYMAIERLHELHHSGQFDLVIIDTPPSRHAIDVLDAPDRLVKFMSNPIYRALTLPGRSLARVTNAASTAFLWTVKRLAGPTIVQETVEFFRSLSGMEAGLRQRAAEMSALLRHEQTSFVLVSSPRAEAIDEAGFLVTALRSGGYRLGAIVANMVHPLPAELPVSFDVASVSGPLADHLAYHAELRQLALDEREELADLRALADGIPLTEVGLRDRDVHDVTALAELGETLVG
jgi:anion-transporting  ArsA/GET3 family ATPase